MNALVYPCKVLLAVLLLGVGVGVQGAVSLSGTRLVFDGQYREVSIEVRNRGKAEALLQTWLSDPLDDDDTPLNRRNALPFVVTPPLSRLPVGGRQALRVLYQGTGMPQERESLVHLYVLEVPRRQDGLHQLNVAVRQRINVFYRPTGLEGDPADTAARLLWTLTHGQADVVLLTVSNPTPYYAALHALRIDGIQLGEHLLLAPGAHVDLAAPTSLLPSATHRFSYKALTDYGGQRTYCTPLKGQVAVTARLLENNPVQDEC
ncbi:molecular chaperone [Pseudomonas syringae pv. tagetis]|uniref:Molecular chaperone n=2 Tax=Pseudomonas syringae group genomosp. 7 TaxID=251699 RepID=A0A0Q0EP99_9PSED|nr:molecular chaperone [Pseudomonas syringae group genomosp. 7]KPY88418.1 Pili assembly chaperone [Pseudomonas syringae pv. tagetis]RMV45404.1 Pili assembly chaperone [Pseudomonas syringae pv. helianthi]RMW21621.1 Pili assembly chaperone [Pseudomonas syringae pv. tagetis]UNB69727.1 molecular chaperone [Pseudomonas syringae pv. tagetis]